LFTTSFQQCKATLDWGEACPLLPLPLATPLLPATRTRKTSANLTIKAVVTFSTFFRF